MREILSQLDLVSPKLGKYRDELLALKGILKQDKIMGFAKGRQIAELLVQDMARNKKRQLSLEKQINALLSSGTIPNEIATLLHYLRVMGNRQHAGTLRIEILERDLSNLLNSILRLLEWFFCEYENGPLFKSIFVEPSSFSITAFRFIPFYVGILEQQNRGTFLGFRALKIPCGVLCYFSDGFAVLAMRDVMKCKDTVDYLLKRRRTHLQILNPYSRVTKELLKIRGASSFNPLITKPPERLEYVMSIHFLNCSVYNVSQIEKYCIADPSLLGITDDPLERISNTKVARARNLMNMLETPVVENFRILQRENHECFVGWANVLFAMYDEDKQLQKLIIRHEIRLQKLWYKLYIYNNFIPSLVSGSKCLRMEAIRKEIMSTKIEYSSLTRVNPTGSNFSNSVILALNDTSNIQKLYEDFANQIKLFTEI